MTTTKTTTYPDHMSRTERHIVDAILTAAIDTKGYLVRVDDDEEPATEWTRDRDVIRPEVAATDITYLCFALKTPEGGIKRVGHIMLVHGNEEDLISDHTDNAAMNDLYEIAVAAI